MLKKLQDFTKRETILCIAFLLAAISCFFVPPDREYATYINVHTILILFCLMVVVAGLKESGLFQWMGDTLLKRIHSERGLAFVLVFLCFFSSMFITNDVALITFVPLAVFLLKMVGMQASFCFLITMMTIAGNLGSMLTPIGNPQNLYLYSISGASVMEFIKIMLPYTVLSGILLAMSLFLFCRKKEIALPTQTEQVRLQVRRLGYYLMLFVVSLFSVAGLLRAEQLFLLILAAVWIENKKLLRQVDYSLLATFVCFFIFIGNMGRLPVFREWIVTILSGHERLVSVGISQVISNVPAALLLSGFTEEWKELVVGTNIGGLGTLIASMASLISYKQVALHEPRLKGRYLLVFTLWNLVFLAGLLVLSVCL